MNQDRTPSLTATLSVWHNWLCHGANAEGRYGDKCPDGCAGELTGKAIGRYQGRLARCQALG